ncbi:MAG: glycosyltransferase [Burkholderiales bacterium]|nr:MAG: glycosyltransferase [Burkholderiales bacterium]
MKVLQINPFIDPEGRSLDALLDAWWTLRHCARGAAEAGAEVSVLQASLRQEALQREGVAYHGLLLLGPDGRPTPSLIERVRALRPDVLHLHGLGFFDEARQLAALLPGRPLLLQDHAARAPSRPWHWWRWRRGLAPARGLIFHAAAQARPFVRRRLVARHTGLYEVPEASSDFQPRVHDAARRLTGVAGAPALLWVGHLAANKDPLTVLDGVARAAERLPGLQLWMCFGEAPLLSAVRERLRDPRLAGRVHLLGRVPHAQVELLMAAADLLVQGSHREGSGYSLIEALACGLPPVVTDIPSFRSLVGELPAAGAAALWPVGQAARLADAIVSLANAPPSRPQVRARFDAHCSVAALGRGLMAAYTGALAA